MISTDKLVSNSKIYGEYYFNGGLVTVYSHYSYRLFLLHNNKIYCLDNSDFGNTIFTKKEWRNIKINTIIK